jgi:nicotinamide mononucleotide transporter
MLQVILDWLNSPAFHLLGAATTWAELFGFITGGMAVYLVAVENIWTWPVGIANALFFFVLFIEAHLYTDAWLQMFFLVSCIVGWVAWLKAGPNRSELRVGHTPWWLLAATGLGIAIFAYLMFPILKAAHGSYPVPDATTTGLSVAAQLLMSYKLLENWYLWMVADIIYIPVYALKGLYFTSALYIIFFALCIKGVRYWWNLLRTQKPLTTEPAGTPAIALTTGAKYDEVVRS